MVLRHIEPFISSKLKDQKAVILLGPRQTGKTTLLNQLTSTMRGPVLHLNGDDADVRVLFENATSSSLKAMLGNAKTLVIDEAQRIHNIGLAIKIIVDQVKSVKVIATGSSAFELANSINEPLTGRKWECHLYPFSFGEMAEYHGELEESRLLKHRMVYGYYPEVVLNPGEEESRLKELASSYLYKDILTWERIQKPERMEKLVQALAFQVGQQVSYLELGQLAGLDNQTTEKYISLLEKAFIVFRLGSLSRNLRNELKKSRKIYFYDNGLRNAVINQFSPIDLRQDTGALWENFMISERTKWLSYRRIHCNRYFWRTHAHQEIDYIEERNGILSAFEFKWNPKAKARIPTTFLKAYPGAIPAVISSKDWSSFLK